MSLPPLELDPVRTNTSNAKILPLYLTPVGAKILNPKTKALPTESYKCKEKAQKEYVPEDPDSDPSSLDPSSIKYDSSDDSKYSKSKIK